MWVLRKEIILRGYLRREVRSSSGFGKGDVRWGRKEGEREKGLIVWWWLGVGGVEEDEEEEEEEWRMDGRMREAV